MVVVVERVLGCDADKDRRAGRQKSAIGARALEGFNVGRQAIECAVVRRVSQSVATRSWVTMEREKERGGVGKRPDERIHRRS